MKMDSDEEDIAENQRKLLELRKKVDPKRKEDMNQKQKKKPIKFVSPKGKKESVK